VPFLCHSWMVPRGNIEQRRNLISREATFRLSAGRFAGFRHVYRSDLGRWAVRVWGRTTVLPLLLLRLPIRRGLCPAGDSVTMPARPVKTARSNRTVRPCR
jgi:hypothetical protein